jgi:hypothetical protein
VKAANTQYRAARNPFFAALATFPYNYGLVLVSKAWRQGGQSAVRALFDDPPTSGMAMRVATGVESLPAGAKLAQPKTPRGLHRDDVGRVGAFLLFGVLGGADDSAFEAAAELAADELLVYLTETDEIVGVWQLRFVGDHGSQAFTEFAARLPAGTSRIEHSGDVTTLVVSESPAGLAQIPAMSSSAVGD